MALFGLLVKILACLLAVLSGLALLAIVLPISIAGTGRVELRGSLEGILEGFLEGPEAGSVAFAGAFEGSVLLGLLRVLVSPGRVNFKIAGASVWKAVVPGRKKLGSGTGQTETGRLEAGKAERRGAETPARPTGAGRSPWGAAKRFLDPHVRGRTLDFLKRLWGVVSFRPKLRLTCGFSDPSITGMVCGACAALSGCPVMSKVRFVADFQKEVIDLEGTLHVSAVPAVVAWHTARFLLSPEIRRLIKGGFAARNEVAA